MIVVWQQTYGMMTNIQQWAKCISSFALWENDQTNQKIVFVDFICVCMGPSIEHVQRKPLMYL